ncbi:MerR family transcriptional regulator [Desulfoscipio geothermicus]|uniref:DNA-binding transcriptional regulator, MerR family n=1 Tax=Desulfoscipio geothermicus DSM 3669 TaxID=1121426 RepID=A0A1I6EE32_9FIRM|nr:MerR family transcriptional regulator [Desulfoscipio geothermicus]SFR16019.1 DNA-binding transcriptional regulator, MerR family [Desulfoscipio geothermicus DSM 3669]
MFTIGQFSKICQVTTKTLRHYEKLGLLVPIRDETGNQYRYYTSEQVPRLKQIVFLKELGIPLKTVKKIIDGKQADLPQLMEEHRRHLLQELDLCSSRLSKLAWWKKSLEEIEVSEKKQYDVRLRDIPAIKVRSRREVLTSFPNELPTLIRSVLEEINSRGGICSGAPIVLYYDDEFNPAQVDVEVAWPVNDDALATGTLAAVKAAVTMHVGPYDGLEGAYQAVFDWINQNGYRALTPYREVSCNDPQVTPPDQLVTEIIIPVA